MKEIRLTRGWVALVDDTDYAALSHYNWHTRIVGPNAYANRNLPPGGRRMMSMHRQIKIEVHAALAYDLAAVRTYGEYALTNFPVSGSTNWIFGEAA